MLNEIQSSIIQYNRVQLNTTNSEQLATHSFVLPTKYLGTKHEPVNHAYYA